MKLDEFERRGGTAEHGREFHELRGRHATTRTVTDVDLPAVGRELRAIRQAAGLSLRALASKVGVSTAFLCNVEHGRRSLNAVHGAIFLATCARETRLGSQTGQKR